MQLYLVTAAIAVLVVTAGLVRRLLSSRTTSATGSLVTLAVAISTSALVTAARGAQAVAIGVAVLGVAAIAVALVGTSDHLR